MPFTRSHTRDWQRDPDQARADFRDAQHYWFEIGLIDEPERDRLFRLFDRWHAEVKSLNGGPETPEIQRAWRLAAELGQPPDAFLRDAVTADHPAARLLPGTQEAQEKP